MNPPTQKIGRPLKITEKAYAKLRKATQRDELLRLGTGFAFLERERAVGSDARGRFRPKVGVFAEVTRRASQCALASGWSLAVNVPRVAAV